jgi:hypothetical protein
LCVRGVAARLGCYGGGRKLSVDPSIQYSTGYCTVYSTVYTVFDRYSTLVLYSTVPVLQYCTVL